MTAYFALEGDTDELVPGSASVSGWHHAHVRGPAITGVLARAAERAVRSRPELRPARATFDLFRPTRMSPSTTRTSVVRQGRRLMLIDSFLEQGGVTTARAQALFLLPTSPFDGQLWAPDSGLEAPPADLRSDPEGRLFRSGSSAWTADASEHANALRKQVWISPTAIVAGEAPTPFQIVASGADLTSLVTHWGEHGVAHINADLTVALSRLPTSGHIGAAAAQHTATDGISIGSAVLFDRDGPFGSSTVTALRADRIVDVADRTGR